MKNLINQFKNCDLTKIEEYKNLINSKENEIIYPPYIPHIGKNYNKYKIFLYGMAQNSQNEFADLKGRTKEEQVRQLYDAKDHNSVSIAPYKVMLALAGIFIYTKHDKTIKSFLELHEYVAATNYYKFSFKDISYKKSKDINPEKLSPYFNPQNYYELNDQLSFTELNTLKPNVIISFKGRSNRIVEELGHQVLTINDPSWIKRGGSGCLKKSGSWYRNITDANVIDLINNYIEQIDGNNYGEKKDALNIYLSKYYSDWIKI